MRFEAYHDGLEDERKISVDGLVPNGLCFTHWPGNSTPAEFKGDTSTEIIVKLLQSGRFADVTRGYEIITNNHFDTDGVLPSWLLLNPDASPDLFPAMIAAAQAGDFLWMDDERAAEVIGEIGVLAMVEHLAEEADLEVLVAGLLLDEGVGGRDGRLPVAILGRGVDLVAQPESRAGRGDPLLEGGPELLAIPVVADDAVEHVLDLGGISDPLDAGVLADDERGGDAVLGGASLVP